LHAAIQSAAASKVSFPLLPIGFLPGKEEQAPGQDGPA
jgi:hypothetical protein